MTYWIPADEPLVYTSITNASTGEQLDLEIYPPSEETAKNIIELGKTLTVPSEQNPIIRNAVIKSGTRYLKDEISLDEAVNAILQEVNLYLSE